MCKERDNDSTYRYYNCHVKCYNRVGGCNNPHSLCKCDRCECKYTYEDRKHELDRINQFEKEARDDAHFRQKILVRAQRCGEEKRERFVQFLKEIGRVDLAAFIEMTMSK